MKRTRAGGGLQPLGAVLRTQGVVAKAPPEVSGSPVAPRDWEAAVGTRIATRAVPVKLERGVLFVKTASATWAQELSLLAEPILAQLNARGVKVSSLRFRVGKVDPPERLIHREDVRTAPPSAPLPKDLKQDIEAVADDALREAIRTAAAKNLGWQSVRRPGGTVGTNPNATSATSASGALLR